MAEYQKMIVICALAAALFFGGYLEPFPGFITSIPWLAWLKVDNSPLLGPVYMFIKIVLLLFLLIWVRATWPRIRYDRLMAFGWKVMVPLGLTLVFITALGILLAEQLGDPRFLAFIPTLSLAAGLVAVIMVDRALRRKAYERR
jgi:NADH-quinone oxidoreductase subunit H